MSEEPTPEEAGSSEPLEGGGPVPDELRNAPESSIVGGEEHVAEANPGQGDSSETKASTDEVLTETSADLGEEDEIAPVSETTDDEPQVKQAEPMSDGSGEAELVPEQEHDDETAIIERVDALDSTPQSPVLGTLHKTPISKVHSLGDLHGWAPGLIAYLIHHQLAEIEIDGYPMQTENGDLHVENLNAAFQSPIVKWHNLPKSGLKGHPGGEWFGAQNDGHGAIKARWIANPSVAFVQVGDIFDRADHSELAAEILRQLIVDAPGRVFVLVGNHEQFMLENDFSNWAHNEVRSAYTDHVQPKKGARAHFRFYNPAIDQDEMMEEVFSRYKSSVWTLFLTQGAVLKELGWLEKDLTKAWDFKGMLDTGWSPYERANTLSKNVKKGDSIPGAISALTMNDILFHHAEPAAHQADRDGHLLELHKTITTHHHPALNEFKMQMYRYGGDSLHDSEDQRLLWARGSSSGANSGNPAAQQHLDDLANHWPGLHRIVHGHTPTVGLSEFNTVTSGESRPVSYNADASHHQPIKGRANKVRVHNIDEGMSPVYFAHSRDDPYDPCRVPIGLRMELNAESQVEANHDSNEHVQIIEEASMRVDRRELWKWQEGQWKSNIPSVFENLGDRLFLGDVQDGWHCLLVIEDSTQQAETSKQLLRNVGGRKVGSMVINRCLHKLVGVPQLETPPAFEHVKPIGLELLQGKTLSLLSSNNISLIAAKIEDKSLKLHVVNGFEKTFDWELSYAPELESKSKKVELSIPVDTHSTYSVINAGVVSVGPPGRSKPAIKFFTTQQGEASTTKGVMAHYISATRHDKTAAHDVREEVYVSRPPSPLPPPRSPPLTRQQRKDAGKKSPSGGKPPEFRKVADHKRDGVGLAAQATRAKPHEKSLQAQVTGADKGKEAPSGASGMASQTSGAKSRQPSNQNRNASRSSRGQSGTGRPSGHHTPAPRPGEASKGNFNSASSTPRLPESKIPDFDLADFTSLFERDVLEKLDENTASPDYIRFQYEVKSGWQTLYFKFIFITHTSMVRIDCAKVKDGIPTTLQKFRKYNNEMKFVGGEANPDSAEGEFLRKIEKLISRLNVKATKIFDNVKEEETT